MRGAAVAALLVVAACSSDKEIEYKEQSVYEIYSQALGYLEEGEYKNAAQYFDEVERQHPYSVWATKAKLMAAYSLYQSNKYDDAITAMDRFIAVHPGNRDVAYAYYLKALCYYEQIADVQRDQDMTKKALDSLQDVVTRFPGTTYARDARLKMDLTRDHLAGKEIAIGRFYQRRVQFLAAINRYKVVVDQYGDTSHVAEALERLTESFMALGLVDEASKSAAVLGYNYPGSDWYKDAYQLVHGTPPKEGKSLPVAIHEAQEQQERVRAAKEGRPVRAIAPPEMKAKPPVAEKTDSDLPPVTTPAPQPVTKAPLGQPGAAPDAAATADKFPPPPPESEAGVKPEATPETKPEETAEKPKLPWWKLW